MGEDRERSLADIGLRMEGLREACDVSVEEMAAELAVSPGTYRAWEETGEDVPISALYHMARKFGVDLTELLTGLPLRRHGLALPRQDHAAAARGARSLR